MTFLDEEVAEKLLETISEVSAIEAVKLLLATAIVVASNTGITEEEVNEFVEQAFSTKKAKRKREFN